MKEKCKKQQKQKGAMGTEAIVKGLELNESLADSLFK